jgi:hypothetical protein
MTQEEYMTNGIFVLLLAVLVTPLLGWACRVLPGEQWQIMATIPASKEEGAAGIWQGSNITFYGLLLATGGMLGAVTYCFLLAVAGMPLAAVFALTGGIMAASLLAAKGIARLVERKKNTLTVAGGATAGLYLMPVAVWLVNHLFPEQTRIMPLLPVMAALATGYIIGEGVGRLACISFGCCYGKPLAEINGIAGRFFSRFACVYYGETKKIAYASGLTGVKVVPIQAVTAFLYVHTGLAGIYFFLEGRFAVCFALTAVFALVWRVFSERFRADYRGQGRVSAYQVMAVVNVLFCLGLLLVPSSPAAIPAVNLRAGLNALWDPAALLFFQTLWLGLFLYTGVSRVTGSVISFHVRKERI